MWFLQFFNISITTLKRRKRPLLGSLIPLVLVILLYNVGNNVGGRVWGSQLKKKLMMKERLLNFDSL